jgi:hypothetical protein
MLRCRRWRPIRPLGCDNGESLLGRRYLHCRAGQGRVIRWDLRGAHFELHRGLRSGCHGPGTRRPCRSGVTRRQGVCAASQSGQRRGRRHRSHVLQLGGPVRSRHQATRLRGIGTCEIDCGQYVKQRATRRALIRSGSTRPRDRAARGGLADLLDRQWVTPCAAGRRSRDPHPRSIRRDDHETKPPTLHLGVIDEPRCGF